MLIKSCLLDRALEVARAGGHKIRVYTNDCKIFEAMDHIDNLQKPCPCGNFNMDGFVCDCTPEQIIEHKRAIERDDSNSNYDIILVIDKIRFENILLNKTLSKESKELLKMAYKELKLKPSQVIASLKVADTIRALDKEENIEPQHIAEAIQYQSRE